MIRITFLFLHLRVSIFIFFMFVVLYFMRFRISLLILFFAQYIIWPSHGCNWFNAFIEMENRKTLLTSSSKQWLMLRKCISTPLPRPPLLWNPVPRNLESTIANRRNTTSTERRPESITRSTKFAVII